MSRKKSSSLQSHNGLFWAFWHKKYCKTSGAKLRSAIELSSLKWSDDSESPWWIYICRLPIDSTVYSFPTLDFVRGIFWIFLPASSPRKPLLNMNFMFLWKKGEKETLKKKKKSTWVKLDFFVVELNIYSQICVVPNLSTSIWRVKEVAARSIYPIS